jgi:arylsulfotransferase ASST
MMPSVSRSQEGAGGVAPAEGWSRADLLTRAAAGAGFVLLSGPRRMLSGVEGAAAATAEAGPVQRFFSRTDLRPVAVTVLRAAAGTDEGFLFLAPSSGPGQRGVLVLDDAGEVVWFHPTRLTAMDFRATFYRGKPVLTWWEGKHIKGVGTVGEYVIVDQSYREIARFSAGHKLRPDFHEFMLTPEGTALVTVYDRVPIDLSTVGGPSEGRVYDGVVQELEIPSARVLFEWRSLEHVGIDESYLTKIYDPHDYFHINSIGFDVDGHLLISARNTWTIYKVHRRTGRVIWRLGGKKSDFAMGKGTRFAFQHDARSHDRGRLISLFDNGPVPNTKRQSRGIVIRLDTRNRRATLATEIVHAPPLFAFATGNTQVLPNRNMLICWGITGQFSEYGLDGTLRFDAKLPKGGQNYRVRRLKWTGRPHHPPKLASHPAPARRRRLYASWNGATELAYWELQVGASAASLKAIRAVPKDGFETELIVPRGTAYAVAVALDGRRRPLSRSNTVRL